MKNQQLDAVTKAKSAYVVAKATLEAKLREQLREQLSSLQTQIDIAVRIAYNSGESKADIMRALGTKDYHTISNSLKRTEGVNEIVGENPLDLIYSLDGDVVSVSYRNHGPASISGNAEFQFKHLDDGTKWFVPLTPLWNESFTEKNDVVAALDGKQDGFYYEEALQWVLTTSSVQ